MPIFNDIHLPSYSLDYITISWNIGNHVKDMTTYQKENLINFYSDMFAKKDRQGRIITPGHLLQEYYNLQSTKEHSKLKGLQFLRDNHYNIRIHFQGSFFRTNNIKDDFNQVWKYFEIFDEFIQSYFKIYKVYCECGEFKYLSQTSEKVTKILKTTKERFHSQNEVFPWIKKSKDEFYIDDGILREEIIKLRHSKTHTCYDIPVTISRIDIIYHIYNTFQFKYDDTGYLDNYKVIAVNKINAPQSIQPFTYLENNVKIMTGISVYPKGKSKTFKNIKLTAYNKYYNNKENPHSTSILIDRFNVPEKTIKHLIRKEWSIRSRFLKSKNCQKIEDFYSLFNNKIALANFIRTIRKNKDIIFFKLKRSSRIYCDGQIHKKINFKSDTSLYKSLHKIKTPKQKFCEKLFLPDSFIKSVHKTNFNNAINWKPDKQIHGLLTKHKEKLTHEDLNRILSLVIEIQREKLIYKTDEWEDKEYKYEQKLKEQYRSLKSVLKDHYFQSV